MEERLSQLEAILRSIQIAGRGVPLVQAETQPISDDDSINEKTINKLVKIYKKSQKEGWGNHIQKELIIKTNREFLEIREFRRCVREEERRTKELVLREAQRRHGTLRKKK